MNTASTFSRVIAVTSGKGGVGKTNIAVNLAIALSDLGRRVILWDLDLGLANVDVVLNLKVKGDLSDVLEGRSEFEAIMVEGPGGIRVVPGASGDERLADLSERERRTLIAGIERLGRSADYLIVDTGAGISRNTIRFSATADEVLLVTTPEPTAMLDAYATVKILAREAPDCEIHLLVNMARSRKEAQNTLWRITASAENFLGSHLEEDGFILFDPAVGSAVRRRSPFLLSEPESEAAHAIRRIAEVIDTHPPTRLRSPEESGFLKRLLRHLGG